MYLYICFLFLKLILFGKFCDGKIVYLGVFVLEGSEGC